MTDNLESLILEQLRHIRGKLDKHDEYFNEIKQRLTDLEFSLVSNRRETTHLDDVSVRQQVSLDKLVARIEIIERRLNIND